MSFEYNYSWSYRAYRSRKRCSFLCIFRLRLSYNRYRPNCKRGNGKRLTLFKKLALRFGEDIILKDGSLDRRLLASRAFSTEEGKRDLNAITHPEIKKSIAQIIEVCKKDNINVLVDAPLLFEAGCDTLCDVIIAVTAPLDLRLNRIIARDNISEKQATERINAQKDDDFYIKKSHYHIINDGDINTLILKTKQIAEDCIK